MSRPYRPIKRWEVNENLCISVDYNNYICIEPRLEVVELTVDDLFHLRDVIIPEIEALISATVNISTRILLGRKL